MCFNPCPARGATKEQKRRTGRARVQSTPPRGAMRMGGAGSYCSGRVSIHAPARGRRGMRMVCHNRERDEFQSTPRAGGDPRSASAKHGDRVSIHAPARGLTLGAGSSSVPEVSIHAPARGATLATAGHHVAMFQSTPPRGGRRQNQAPSMTGSTVSIHAPARGATRTPSAVRSAGGFNPRLRAGGDITDRSAYSH